MGKARYRQKTDPNRGKMTGKKQADRRKKTSCFSCESREEKEQSKKTKIQQGTRERFAVHGRILALMEDEKEREQQKKD